MEWFLVVLISISLMTSDTDHLFMHLSVLVSYRLVQAKVLTPGSEGVALGWG